MNKSISLIGKIVLLLLIPTSTLWANPRPPRWRCIDNSAPARYGHKCAYDQARQNLVLFGGKDLLEQMPGDTWIWQDAWTRYEIPGPVGRIAHGLCYDTIAQVSVLFGGQDQSGQFLNDTWIWNGISWSQIDSTGPSPRAFFVLACDLVRNRIVLFGGTNGDSTFGDTWEWDGAQWLHRSAEGPSPRIMAGMVYDDIGHRCVLFGGQMDTNSSAFNDTWAWDGSSWSQVQTVDPPSARIGHSMAYCAMMETVVLFGGQNSFAPDTIFGDTWWLLYDEWMRMDLPPEPPARAWADMTPNYRDYNSILVGGKGESQIYQDVWEYANFDYNYFVGDSNNDGYFSGLDVIYSINYLKGSGPPPPFSVECWPAGVLYAAADANGSCSFNGLDVTYSVNYLKGIVPYLRPCPDCPPGR